MNFAAMESLPEGLADSLGWIPFERRTDDENQAHDANVAKMPTLLIGDGGFRFDRDKAFLWEFWPKANGGKTLLTTRQNIGSCVGHGKYNAERSLMCVDIALRGDNEIYTELFEPYGYGRSRLHAGIRGRGSGSTGSGAAEAAKVDGVLSRDGLSGWSESGDTVDWSDNVDTEWSDGARIGEEYIARGRKHLVKTTAPVRSAADVRAAIQAGFACTIASNWGGQMRPSVADGVLLNRRVTTWNHQMSIHGWWEHQSHGEIFYIWNSWGADAHGKCPSGAPLGGFWVKAADVDYICRQDDSFAYSQFDGFPDNRPFDTLLI